MDGARRDFDIEWNGGHMFKPRGMRYLAYGLLP